MFTKSEYYYIWHNEMLSIGLYVINQIGESGLYTKKLLSSNLNKKDFDINKSFSYYIWLLNKCKSLKISVLIELVQKRIQYFKDTINMDDSLFFGYLRNTEKNIRMICLEISLYGIIIGNFFDYNLNEFCDIIQKDPLMFLTELYEISKSLKKPMANKIAAMLQMAVYNDISSDCDNSYLFLGGMATCNYESVQYYTFRIMFYITTRNNIDDPGELLSINTDINTQLDFFIKNSSLYKNEDMIIAYNIYRNIDYKDLFRKIIKNEIVIKTENDKLLSNFSLFMINNPVMIKGTKFLFGRMKRTYYVDNKLKDLFVYKGQNVYISFSNFMEWNKPTWYADYSTAYNYTKKPVANNDCKQGVYAFSPYMDMNIFLITKENLINLKKLFGNVLVWSFCYDNNDWRYFIKRCVEFGLISNEQLGPYEGKNILTYETIINFCFFFGGSDKITRRSVYLIDIAFVRGLCSVLNKHISFYANPGVKTQQYDINRIDGYYANPLDNYNGYVFHKEFAICNPYKNLERRIDNKYDYFHSSYLKMNEKEKSSRRWCVSEKSGNIDCIATLSYKEYDKIYLKYWSMIEDWVFQSYKNFNLDKIEAENHIDQWKSFNINIKTFNSIKSCIKCDTTNDLINFCKIFMNRLFYNISQSPYKLVPSQIEYETQKVWRPNHGSVHHMRSLAISIELYKLMEKRNVLMYQLYMPTKRHILVAILASVFISLLRIDEDNNIGTKGLKLPFNDVKLWSKIFPTLAKHKGLIEIVEKEKTFSLTQLSSCFMFMAIMKSVILPDDHEFVELLGFSNILYIKDDINELYDYMKSGSTNYDPTDINYKFSILHGFTMFPHYMDHCRGSFSTGLYRTFIYKSLYDVGLQQNDLEYLNFISIYNILKTGERSKWNNKDINQLTMKDVREKCMYTKEQFEKEVVQKLSNDKFQKCCKLFSNDRYKSKLFFDLSTNFNQIWDLLLFRDNLTLALSNNNIVYFYDDNKKNFSNYVTKYKNTCSYISENLVYNDMNRGINLYNNSIVNEEHVSGWLKYLNKAETQTIFYALLVVISNGFTLTYNYKSGVSYDQLLNLIKKIDRKELKSIVFDLDYTLAKDLVMYLKYKKLINRNFENNKLNNEKWNEVKNMLLHISEKNELSKVGNIIKNIVYPIDNKRNEDFFDSNGVIPYIVQYYFGDIERIELLRKMYNKCIKNYINFYIVSANPVLKSKSSRIVLNKVLRTLFATNDDINLIFSKTGDKLKIICP